MKFVGVRDFRSGTAGIWADLKKERELVITSNGKPVALLTAVNEDDFEKAIKDLRRARAITATESLQARSLQSGLDQMTPDQIDGVIHKSRRAR